MDLKQPGIGLAFHDSVNTGDTDVLALPGPDPALDCRPDIIDRNGIYFYSEDFHFGSQKLSLPLDHGSPRQAPAALR